MSGKPSDIPDDIWVLAAYEGMAYKAKRREIVARAIMAERERCEAEIARLKLEYEAAILELQ